MASASWPHVLSSRPYRSSARWRGEDMSTSNFTDSQFLAQCQLNATFDPTTCPCLLSGGGPELNTDISGPGVRISFYLQSLFLALLSALSKKPDDIANALYTLVVTNIAVVLASLVLGFKPDPSMSLHDAIVIIYLLVISWTSTLFAFPCVPYKNIGSAFGVVYTVQSYSTFAYVCAVLIKARTFGKTYRCNTHAVVFIFAPFRAFNAGRILAIASLAIVFVLYTVLTIFDYGLWKPSRYKQFWRWMVEKFAFLDPDKGVEAIDTEGVTRDRERQRNPRRIPSDFEHAFLDHLAPGGAVGNAKKEDELTKPFYLEGRSFLQSTIIFTLWSISLANTERLIVVNRFDGGEDGLGSNLWGFGQILPIILVLLPAINLAKILVELYRTKGQRRKKIHKVFVSILTLFQAGFATGPGPCPQFSESHDQNGCGRGHDHGATSRRSTCDERLGPSGWSFGSPFSGMNEARQGANMPCDQPAAHISETSIPITDHDAAESDPGNDQRKINRSIRQYPPRSSSTSSQLSYVTEPERSS